MEVIIILLCLSTTTVICNINHHPQVYEDVVENSIRNVRNPQTPYRMSQPPVYNAHTARQQDYLKERYSQQQRAEATAMANSPTRPFNIYVLANKRIKKDTEGWQPIQPQITKQNFHQVRGFLQIKQAKSIDNNNIVLPNILRNHLSRERVLPQTAQQETNYSKSSENLNSKLSSNLKHGDMLGASSEVVEDRRDLRNPYKQIVYVHPNHVNQPNQIINPSTFQKPESQLTALSDLIGKNPNVQLEGLKRLVQDPPRKDYVQSSVREPEPFEIRDHKPISEANIGNSIPQLRLNIQQSNAGNILAALKSPGVVTKDSFDNLQKQLDEASNRQVQQVLARAQQEANAQVEAQHKAIALAQLQAQKVALENIQQSIYSNAPTLPLVQPDSETPPHAQPLISIPHTLKVSSNVANFPSIQGNGIGEQRNVQLPVTEPPQILHTQVTIPPANTRQILPFRNNHLYKYGQKELLHYAPNHQHQAVAHHHAEKALAAQVQAENAAILHSQEKGTAAKHHILESEEEESSNFETNDISKAESVEPEPATSSAYQEIAEETKQTQDNGIYAPVEEKNPDDLEDLQYAAKYAFGYRVKDMKEQNDFGHAEHRNGKSAEGSYHVLLPDGRLQKVKYYADDTGYHAKVTYEYVNKQ